MGKKFDLCMISSKISMVYLNLVYKTSDIKFIKENGLEEKYLANCILGFWHGESYTMYLLLKKMFNNQEKIKVVVTASRRGDYIEDTCESYQIKALRMPDGLKMKSFLKELKLEAMEKESTTCIALDGPLGPLHEPKKVAFLLSNISDKPFVGVRSFFSRKITLKNRWDNYVIPLPFSKIRFYGCMIGNISNDQLKNFKEYKEEIKEKLTY